LSFGRITNLQRHARRPAKWTTSEASPAHPPGSGDLPSKPGFQWSVVFLMSVCLATGCSFFGGFEPSDRRADSSSAVDQGLLTAYVLLEETLSQESKLGALGFLKKITFREPVPEIDDIMSRLSDVSSERLDELELLRALSPDVSAGPDYMDPIGEAITSNATDSGMDEMLDWDGSFGIRFILLQAQATRMVGAIAIAAADIEPNQRRKKWLGDLAAEYEAIRDELVVILEKYVMQEGQAQKE
jgi:hypothetical protein